MPMTEAAIRARLAGDLYVSLGDSVGDDSFGVSLRSKPLVSWIWGGCLLMALGGALAASDRRYRLSLRKTAPGTLPSHASLGGATGAA
jgi:cytochrome c-type biogenesis protein CcmF